VYYYSNDSRKGKREIETLLWVVILANFDCAESAPSCCFVAGADIVYGLSARRRMKND